MHKLDFIPVSDFKETYPEKSILYLFGQYKDLYHLIEIKLK